MNQIRLNEERGLEKEPSSRTREVDAPGLENWLCAGAALTAFSLLTVYALVPELTAALGLAGGRSAKPSVLLVALQTLPLHLALLASALLPAAFVKGEGSFLERLKLFRPTRKQFAFALGMEALLLPGLMLVSGLCKLLSDLLRLGLDGQQVAVREAMQSSPGGFATLCVSAILVAPVVEELAFRRVVFGFLKGFAGTLPAALTASALFAATHCSVLQFPALFLLGLALQWTCVRFNSLAPAILLHCLHNLVSMLLLLWLRLQM